MGGIPPLPGARLLAQSLISGNPFSKSSCLNCATSMLMVCKHNGRLRKIQIQKQLLAGLVHTEDEKGSVERTPKPTHLPTALVRSNSLLRVREHIADLLRRARKHKLA